VGPDVETIQNRSLNTGTTEAEDPLVLPGEEEFVRLDREYPGFGGYSYDSETGDLLVVMADLKHADAVRTALEPRLAEIRPTNKRDRKDKPGRVRVVQGKFRFGQLRIWRDQLTPAIMGQPGVTMLDINEHENRLFVGITSPPVRRFVMQEAMRLNIAPDGIAIETVEPICPVQSDGDCNNDPCTLDPTDPICTPAEPGDPPPSDDEPETMDPTCPEGTQCSLEPAAPTLRNYRGPMEGGLQIQRLRFQLNGLNYVANCTYGFTTTYNGQVAFVTNSHCSSQRGVIDGTLWYSPFAPRNADYIGREVADPPNNVFRDAYTGNYCPRYRECRYSDAAIGELVPGRQYIRRSIARTTHWTGSIEINQSNPHFFIYNEHLARPVMNRDMDKVGRTTGWTYGRTSNTCTHISNGNYIMFCQALVETRTSGARIVAGGDSGSPVFLWDFANGAVLYGLLWGEQSEGTRFIFSPLDNLRRDLGPISAL
jgi:hypothetical protein